MMREKNKNINYRKYIYLILHYLRMELTCRKKNSQLPFRKRDNILLTFKDKLSKIYSH